jgi:hypothetical protein
VHEPDIAPLARRLAEENNVDWRRLAGSGDAGRVVERDVLGYLARVMAGEEAVDPTPEPVPHGMTAWPEDDVAAYRARADQEPSEGSPPTVEDELFLFDDPPPAGAVGDDPWLDDASNVATATGAAERSWSGDALQAPVDDDAVLLMGDDPAPVAPATDPDVWDADDVGFDVAGDAERRAVEQVHTPGARNRFDLPDLFATDDLPEPESGGGPDLLFEDDETGLRGRPVASNGALRLDERPASAPGGDLWLDQAPAAAPAGELSLDDASEARRGVDTLELDAAMPARADAAHEPFDDPTAAHPHGGADPADAVHDGVVPAVDATERRDTAVAAGGAPLASVQGVAFVRHGQVWRRRFDDRPLRKAASEVAAELEAPVGVVTAVLLARAAHRARATAGPIDALRWRDGRTLRGAVPTDGDLRGAVALLRDEPSAGALAALVVADLSDLDLDEAVLHLDAPLLALSRSGGDGAWLSLSGDEVDVATVDALARVATLLAAPVRLLV